MTPAQRENLAIEKLQLEFLDHLRINRGNIYEACRSMKIGRDRYLSWLNEDQGFRFQVMVIAEELGDFVEGQLLQKIMDGDTASIIFYCKTKLKHRGYVEDLKQVPTGGSRTKINVSVNMPNSKPQFTEAEIVDNED
jgi:hypothetical protein